MESLPVSPHDLLWWQWLLWAAGCWTFAAAARFKLRNYLGGMAEPLAFIGIAVGLFCLAFAIIRYTGWFSAW